MRYEEDIDLPSAAAHLFLSGMYFSVYSSLMPFYSYLFAVCY
jgi:hypothetical protein